MKEVIIFILSFHTITKNIKLHFLNFFKELNYLFENNNNNNNNNNYNNNNNDNNNNDNK